MTQKTHIVTLSVTASATEVKNQFKGIVVFKDKKNKEIKFDYLFMDHEIPMDKYVDFKFSNEKENFQIEGIPSNELMNKLEEKNQLIVFFTSLPLRDAIYHVKDFLRMSYGNISQMGKMYKTDSPFKVSEDIFLTEIGYKLIFESKFK